MEEEGPSTFSKPVPGVGQWELGWLGYSLTNPTPLRHEMCSNAAHRVTPKTAPLEGAGVLSPGVSALQRG